MEYTISKFAKLSGVSARTLRYYDEIGLLKPKRMNSSGYRIYGQEEVDLLQQILFYREVEMSLDEIKAIIHAEGFDINVALRNHLHHLTRQRKRIDHLIQTVEQSIQAKEGEKDMSDQEKFEAFKNEAIQKNNEKYGDEIREKYRDDVIAQSNKRISHLTKEEWSSHQALTETLNEKLVQATKAGDPNNALAQEVAALHKEWLIAAWPKDYYDAEKHYNISLMYVEDSRFNAYYEAIAPGAAEFLHEALKVYLNK